MAILHVENLTGEEVAEWVEDPSAKPLKTRMFLTDRRFLAYQSADNPPVNFGTLETGDDNRTTFIPSTERPPAEWLSRVEFVGEPAKRCFLDVATKVT